MRPELLEAGVMFVNVALIRLFFWNSSVNWLKIGQLPQKCSRQAVAYIHCCTNLLVLLCR